MTRCVCCSTDCNYSYSLTHLVRPTRTFALLFPLATSPPVTFFVVLSTIHPSHFVRLVRLICQWYLDPPCYPRSFHSWLPLIPYPVCFRASFTHLIFFSIFAHRLLPFLLDTFTTFPFDNTILLSFSFHLYHFYFDRQLVSTCGFP